jgi:hypothetical protein
MKNRLLAKVSREINVLSLPDFALPGVGAAARLSTGCVAAAPFGQSKARETMRIAMRWSVAIGSGARPFPTRLI